MTGALFLCAVAAFAQFIPDCPAGSERVVTNNAAEPFHCKPIDSGQPSIIKMTPNYKRLSCPQGFQAQETPGQKSRYRCVPLRRPEEAEPEVTPVLVPPAQRGKPGDGKTPRADSFVPPADYVRYTIKDQIQVEIPRDWHVVNGWEDEVPTLYVEFDTGRQGKQVAVVVSKIARSQNGFEDVETAISHEKEYQNAAEVGKAKIGTFPARVTAVAGASKTAYVMVSDDEYFTLNYSAPDDLYKTFEPVYKRLLLSFKVSKRLQGSP